MASSPDLLRVEKLGVTFAGPEPRVVLRDIFLALDTGESLAVVGASGSGKTTLLLAVAGLVRPTAGTVTLDGRFLGGPTRDIAFVPQEHGLFPWKRVRENILLGALIQGIRVDPDELAALVHDLGLEGLERLYPHQLSGGQRQRVALARALLLRPRLLLLDEPFAALDAITRERLQNHLLDLWRRRGFGFIVVTHSIGEAVVLGRRITVLDGASGSFSHTVENDGVGGPDYRTDPLFFRREVEVRRLLEGAA